MYRQQGVISPLVIGIIIGVALLGGVVYIFSRPAEAPTVPIEETSTSIPTDNSQTSGYQGKRLAGSRAPLLEFMQSDYDQAITSGKLVVLYFYANWCPVCREETANALYPIFNELTSDDVIGFRVNYNDNETDAQERALARQFGVAYQHTKVFVRGQQRLLKSPEGWDLERYQKEIQIHSRQ